MAHNVLKHLLTNTLSWGISAIITTEHFVTFVQIHPFYQKFEITHFFLLYRNYRIDRIKSYIESN